MFFVFPIGHDQPVYERPWLTIGLILACAGLLAVTMAIEVSVEKDLEDALVEIDAVLAQHPDARVSFPIEGLPEGIEPIITPLIDTTPGRRLTEGDLALEEAMRHLVAAMNRIPALAWGFRPAHPDAGRALASMFLHGGFFHLAGNMLLLWVAGGVLECFWRRWAYVLLYFGAGFVGIVAHTLSDPSSLTPVVGASGAVSGLLGAFLVGYPRTKVKLLYLGWFFRPFFGRTDRPAWVVIPLWAGLEVLNAVFSSGSEVAHWAHVGGFVFGAGIALLARQLHWVAEDAGVETSATVREEVPLFRQARRPREVPSPEVAPAPALAPAASPRPTSRAPEAIDLSTLPPPSDDDHFS